FEGTESMNDLDRAIMSSEQAVKFEPDDHPECAIYLYNLGNVLQTRFEHIRSMDDFDQAIMTMKQAVTICTAPPSIRIRAADSASRLLIGRDWVSAKTVLQTAVELLPSTSPRTLTDFDQQYN